MFMYRLVHLSFALRRYYASQTFWVCRTEKGHKWNEMNILESSLGRHVHRQQPTVSTNSSLSGLSSGRGFIEREWIDGAQEVGCPWGENHKPLTKSCGIKPVSPVLSLLFTYSSLFCYSILFVQMCLWWLKWHISKYYTFHYITVHLNRVICLPDINRYTYINSLCIQPLTDKLACESSSCQLLFCNFLLSKVKV